MQVYYYSVALIILNERILYFVFYIFNLRLLFLGLLYSLRYDVDVGFSPDEIIIESEVC